MANRAAQEFYQYSLKELLELTIYDINQLAPQEINRQMESAGEQQQKVFQFTHKRADGSLCPVEVYSTPITLKGERFLYSIIHDVSSKAVAQKALLHSEERLYAFYTAGREGLLVHRDGVISDLNQACSRLFEVERQGIVGRSLFKLLRGEKNREALLEIFSVVGEPVEATLELCSGRRIHVEALTQEMKWDGERQHVTSILDISKRKQMEEHLLQGQRLSAIGQLAGGVAHDFNNLLGAILGFSDISLAILPEDHEVREYLKKIKGAGKRARDLVAQILTFSREKGSHRKILDLNALLKEAEGLLKGAVPSTVSISVRLCPRVCAVRANPTELLQIILNVATNGMQSIKGHGSIFLGTSLEHIDSERNGVLGGIRPGRYSVLKIEDTGGGMAPEVLAKIFDPYFTTKPVGRGTGLGLSVVYGIVKSHRGNIIVRSDEDVGTTFEFYFPAIHTEEHALVREAPPAHLTGGNERILLVDDEPALVEMGTKILRLLGYHVTRSSSSREALELIKGAPDAFDLLVTDQTMPGMTGTELVAAARAVIPSLPVLLVTGYNSRINRTNAAEYGIDHFYMKPFEMHELAKAIRRALGDLQ